MTADEVRALLRAECEKAGSARAWAAQHKAHPSTVSEFLMGRREPTPAIMRALGLVKVVRYEPAPQKRRVKMEAKRGGE